MSMHTHALPLSTHAHLSTKRKTTRIPPAQPFDCCCFVLQLTSEVFFIKWTARWLQNCVHRWRRRRLLGYAAGSTKALSAACHASGIYKCHPGLLQPLPFAWGLLNYVPTQVHEIAHGIELWHMSPLRRRRGVLIACKWCGGLAATTTATATPRQLRGVNKWRQNHSCKEGFD